MQIARENQRQFILPNTLQQNGVIQFKESYISGVAHSMLLNDNLSKYLWGKNIVTTNYAQNQSLRLQKHS